MVEGAKLNVVVAGGGTGGHIFPALAVGAEFMRRGASVTFVGTKRGLESELIPRRGWGIVYIETPRWKGESRARRAAALMQIPRAVFRARKLVAKLKPDIVVGVGGYASVPMIIAAALKGIPTLLMEQNSIPGLANRALGRIARRICITFPASEKYFSRKKVVFTGNPVREEIKTVGKDIPPVSGRFVLMCFGGSQGAKSINEAMFAALRHLRERAERIRIIHQIGFSMDIEIARDIYKKEGFDAEVHRFIDDMADSYSRAHLLVCRAGATSISEMMVAARPAVLIPYPYAANDHQRWNAKYVVDAGGAVLVDNSELSGETLAKVIVDIMDDPARLKKMNEALKKMARPDAAARIVDECLAM